jgi:hypothetical protein
MPRKTGEVIRRPLIPEVVEEEERVEVVGFSKPERPPQLDSRAFHRGLRLDDLSYRANGHA